MTQPELLDATEDANAARRKQLETLTKQELVDLVLRGGRGRGRRPDGGGKAGKSSGSRGRGRGRGASKNGRGSKNTFRREALTPDAIARTPMRSRDTDRPQLPPAVPIGENSNTSVLRGLCPNQHYPSCFGKALRQKYKLHTVFRKGGFYEPVESAAALFPGCAPLPRRAAAPSDGPSFVDLALEPSTRDATAAPPTADEAAAVRGLQGRLRDARKAARGAHGGARLVCDSSAARLDGEAQLLLGVPSYHGPTASGRRAGARASWMRSALVGQRLAVCFLLSAHYGAGSLTLLEKEAAEHGDMLFLDEKETPQILTQPTRYSGFSKHGRGMPTFKQFAFFRHAARHLPSVPFVGKLDDDSALNPPTMLAVLSHLRCAAPRLLVGSINWASVVPRATDTGVRADRCGFGWQMSQALDNFGSSFGTPGSKGFFPSCDGIGGVPPFPYGIGAGYIFSAALLNWVATAPQVLRWVAEARGGPEREALQWQKFEDTSTGYFLTYSPEPVEYVDIGVWVHDMTCHARGEEKRTRVGLYRPPARSTIIAHNLKRGGFSAAWELMQPNASYDDRRCKADWPDSPLFREAGRAWPIETKSRRAGGWRGRRNR